MYAWLENVEGYDPRKEGKKVVNALFALARKPGLESKVVKPATTKPSSSKTSAAKPAVAKPAVAKPAAEKPKATKAAKPVKATKK
jgi:hypothetical protein